MPPLPPLESWLLFALALVGVVGLIQAVDRLHDWLDDRPLRAARKRDEAMEVMRGWSE